MNRFGALPVRWRPCSPDAGELRAKYAETKISPLGNQLTEKARADGQVAAAAVNFAFRLAAFPQPRDYHSSGDDAPAGATAPALRADPHRRAYLSAAGHRRYTQGAAFDRSRLVRRGKTRTSWYLVTDK